MKKIFFAAVAAAVALVAIIVVIAFLHAGKDNFLSYIQQVWLSGDAWVTIGIIMLLLMAETFSCYLIIYKDDIGNFIVALVIGGIVGGSVGYYARYCQDNYNKKEQKVEQNMSVKICDINNGIIDTARAVYLKTDKNHGVWLICHKTQPNEGVRSCQIIIADHLTPLVFVGKEYKLDSFKVGHEYRRAFIDGTKWYYVNEQGHPECYEVQKN